MCGRLLGGSGARYCSQPLQFHLRYHCRRLQNHFISAMCQLCPAQAWGEPVGIWWLERARPRAGGPKQAQWAIYYVVRDIVTSTRLFDNTTRWVSGDDAS